MKMNIDAIKQKMAQKGQASIEAVMSLLLFTAMLGTLLSLSMYMYINHTFLTAAKEGARAAAVESGLASGGTYATSEQTVKDRVKDFMENSSGITLDDSDITLTGPTGTVGNRTVTVDVSFEFDNPVRVREFMSRMSGQGAGTDLDKVPISSSASMHYEE